MDNMANSNYWVQAGVVPHEVFGKTATVKLNSD